MKEIKRVRKNRKISQAELGKMIGVTAASVSRYENGEREPSVAILRRIAHALDVTVADLIGEGV